MEIEGVEASGSDMHALYRATGYTKCLKPPGLSSLLHCWEGISRSRSNSASRSIYAPIQSRNITRTATVYGAPLQRSLAALSALLAPLLKLWAWLWPKCKNTNYSHQVTSTASSAAGNSISCFSRHWRATYSIHHKPCGVLYEDRHNNPI